METALDKMQAEWAGLCFDTLSWRATGCTILRAVDDIQQVVLPDSLCAVAIRRSRCLEKTVPQGSHLLEVYLQNTPRSRKPTVVCCCDVPAAAG